MSENGGQGKMLANRHAIVTGGARGIGAAIAQALAAEGARVTLVGRTRDRLESARQALPGERDAHTTVVADVTDAHAVERAIGSACAHLGAPFILVNNAGASASASFMNTDEETWRRMFESNVMGAVFCTRSVLPAMTERGEGRVVNVASTAGLTGYRYVSAYVAAKHALVGMTRTLALEVARSGVTVNAVCPGYTDTDLLTDSIRRAAARTRRSEEEIRQVFVDANPQGRLIQPDEVARTVLWLCDPMQRSVNGQAIVVDGGSLL